MHFGDPILYQNIGKIVQNGRIKAGMSQRELADKLGYISSQFISNCERGKATFPAHTLKKISNILKINPEVFSLEIENGMKRLLQGELFK